MAEFTILDRDRKFVPFYYDVMFDARLKLQTRTVLMMMLSRREGWDYSVRGMAAIAGVSKDTMASMIRELETAGYIRRDTQTRTDGKFGKAHYFVSSSPLKDEDIPSSPCPNFSDTASPCPNFSYTENSDTVTDLNKNIIYKQDYIPPIVPQGGTACVGEKKTRARSQAHKDTADWKSLRFEGFWKYYHSIAPKVNSKRQATIRAWDKLKPSDELIDTMGQALKRFAASDEWRRGIGIPHASTWLNGRWWEEAGNLPAAPADAEDGGWSEDKEVI